MHNQHRGRSCGGGASSFNPFSHDTSAPSPKPQHQPAVAAQQPYQPLPPPPQQQYNTQITSAQQQQQQQQQQHQYQQQYQPPQQQQYQPRQDFQQRGESTGGGISSINPFSHDGQGNYANPYLRGNNGNVQHATALHAAVGGQQQQGGGNASKRGLSHGGGASSFNIFSHDGQGSYQSPYVQDTGINQALNQNSGAYQQQQQQSASGFANIRPRQRNMLEAGRRMFDQHQMNLSMNFNHRNQSAPGGSMQFEPPRMDMPQQRVAPASAGGAHMPLSPSRRGQSCGGGQSSADIWNHQPVGAASHQSQVSNWQGTGGQGRSSTRVSHAPGGASQITFG